MGGQRRTDTCTDGIFPREINETMLFEAPWMSLEVITQLVVTEKAKDTYPMVSLIGVI